MEENTRYPRLKSYLEGGLDDQEVYLSEDQLERIAERVYRDEAAAAHVGYRFERTEHNPRELAFYEQWVKENDPKPGVNNGHGILQDLFIEGGISMLGPVKFLEVITDRDRRIVATIIQWLGSNVGMAFLHEALAKFGCYIATKDKQLGHD